MTIKKIMIFLALSGVIIFNSCNDTKPETPEKSITFWHFWSEPYQKKVLDSIIASFEKESGIKVLTTELSWNDGKTKLFAAFNSKTAPDVLELGSDWVAQFSSSGVLAQLDPAEMNSDKFIEFSLEPTLWDNKTYALPWIVDSRVLYINNDLLKEAGYQVQNPGTYDVMLKNAQKINHAEGIYGFGANGSDEHRLYKKIVPMFWSNGGEVLDKNGKPVINSFENIYALQMYVSLSQSGYIETQKDLDNKFAQGKIAYWFSGSWLMEKIKNINPDLNYSVNLVPGFKDSLGVSFAGGEYIAISEQSEKKDDAKKFAEFLTNGKNAIEFCKKINAAGFPADKNYYNDDFYKSHPKREMFGRQLQYARMTPVHPKWLEIEKIIETAAVKALYGEMTAKDALDEAQEEVEELLAK